MSTEAPLRPAEFLHGRAPVLYRTEPVRRAVKSAQRRGRLINAHRPAEHIYAYLQSLAHHALLALSPDDPGEAPLHTRRRAAQIEARVITRSNFPERYFAARINEARDRGQGEWEFTERERETMMEKVQTDQRNSFAAWVNHVSGEHSRYPLWFRYFALSGISQLADYNRKKGSFAVRTKTTTDPYPSVNHEAVGQVFDKLNEMISQGTGIKQFARSATFGKLYVEALSDIGFIDPELLKKVDGSWVTYKQSKIKKAVERVVKSLKGYGTGWCLANTADAARYLEDGDLYIFYSHNKNNNPEVPRLVISVKDGQVTEVRGIFGDNQEIEPAMITQAQKKLATLPGGDAYEKKAADMKLLTDIYDRVKKDPLTSLSRDEIRFIYEFYNPIEGFGLEGVTDFRIEEIWKLREKIDYPELKQLYKEKLSKQLTMSYKVYTTIRDRINSTRGEEGQLDSVDKEKFMALFAQQIAAWEKNGTLDYLLKNENYKKDFILLATPNIEVSADALFELARLLRKQYVKDSNYVDYVKSDTDEISSQYTPTEISGVTASGLSIRFSLISQDTDFRFDRKSVPELRQALAKVQTENPKVTFGAPSLLDALVFLQMLHDSDQLYGGNSSMIIHFDLPEKTIKGYQDSFVPITYALYPDIVLSASRGSKGETARYVIS